jgi:kinesin family protein 18/19
MIGTYTSPGIMTKTLHDLFEKVSHMRDDVNFQIKCSFLEVYNETIRDLLNPTSEYLELREDPVKGMCVAGISEVSGLSSAQEIIDLLHRGNRNRTTEPTAANVTSSRSHAVLQVTVEQKEKGEGLSADVHIGKLSMIDLAGSERASQTHNKGIRLLEGANINRSLLALGNCITALADSANSGKSSFVPYRDSKLTRLLKDSLGGNCRTVMIANASPLHLNYEDTHNTLKYANRAKNIKTKAIRNVLRVENHIAKYTQIIGELKSVVTDLRTRLAETERQISQQPQSPILAVSNGADDAGEVWKRELTENVQERVELKKAMIDLENEIQNQQTAKAETQLLVSQWETSKQGQSADEDADEETGTADTPRTVTNLRDDLQTIADRLSELDAQKSDLEIRIAENDAKLKTLQTDLPARIQNENVRTFLQLLYRNQVLEVETMQSVDQVAQLKQVHREAMKQKSMEIEKLRLQIRLRDTIIAELKAVLTPEQQEMMEKGSKHVSFLPCRTGEILVTKQPIAPEDRRLRFEEKTKPYTQPYSLLAQFQAHRRNAGPAPKFRAAQMRARSEKNARQRQTSPRAGRN